MGSQAQKERRLMMKFGLVATVIAGGMSSAVLGLGGPAVARVTASQPAGGSSAIVEPAGVDHHVWLNPITSKALAPMMDTGVHHNR
ncbi:hypothetical protein ACVWWN_006432 [Mycobacterium sp. URHB0021]|jgi:hypothetical protein